MFIDTHVHTNKYSECSILDPVSLVYRAKELKLSGVVITEHYYVWTQKEIEDLKNETDTDLIILRGREIDSFAGHLLVFGYYDDPDENFSTISILNKARSAGGIVIMAHPFRDGNNIDEFQDVLKNKFGYFDGVEVLNGNQNKFENEFGRRVWKELDLIGIAGSDAHSFDMIGKYVTWFENEIKDEKDFIAEIKAGRCRPVEYIHNKK